MVPPLLCHGRCRQWGDAPIYSGQGDRGADAYVYPMGQTPTRLEATRFIRGKRMLRHRSQKASQSSELTFPAKPRKRERGLGGSPRNRSVLACFKFLPDFRHAKTPRCRTGHAGFHRVNKDHEAKPDCSGQVPPEDNRKCPTRQTTRQASPFLLVGKPPTT
jgi:hypothetical protein